MKTIVWKIDHLFAALKIERNNLNRTFQETAKKKFSRSNALIFELLRTNSIPLDRFLLLEKDRCSMYWTNSSGKYLTKKLSSSIFKHTCNTLIVLNQSWFNSFRFFFFFSFIRNIIAGLANLIRDFS